MVNTKKPLYRLPKQGLIAGVCAGLADYFDFDVTLIRVIFVIAAFITGGAVVIMYIILAIVLPVDASDDTVSEKVQRLGQDLKKNQVVHRMRNYAGIGLVIFGIWLLMSQFWPQWFMFRWEFIWPVILIIVGILIIFRRRK